MTDFNRLIDRWPWVFQQYFDRKWTRGVVKYKVKTGEPAIDVRTLLNDTNDAIEMQGMEIGDSALTADDAAINCLREVMKRVLYKRDRLKHGRPEYWQTASETWKSGTGDCEDGAILLMKLMQAAEIPSFRRKICAGWVRDPATGKPGGHAYVIYLNKNLVWVVLDWCYYALDSISNFIKSVPQSRQEYRYYDLWFSFNELYCWPNQTDTIIKWKTWD